MHLYAYGMDITKKGDLEHENITYQRKAVAYGASIDDFANRGYVSIHWVDFGLNGEKQKPVL